MLSFGTDGLRGDTRHDLTADLVWALGVAAAGVLEADCLAIGRDPRESGPALAVALGQGVTAAGGEPVHLGVLPTPAVARWCDDHKSAGAMVSASHNPWHDNGVKLFAPGGSKLDDTAQTEIESRMQQLMSDLPNLASADRRSQTEQSENSPELSTNEAANASMNGVARGSHLDAVVASIGGRHLDGLSVVVDCANGAASISGPECLRRLGAEVRPTNASPNGRNINDICGSLHPEALQAAVVACGADAGVAFDGDADRVVAVDHHGQLVDGDQILAVCAIDRSRRGQLTGDAVVVTVMANLGLRLAMLTHGIDIVETAVGDRHVLGALEERGLMLGGEQSGHLIFRDLATTGDGLLTAVQLLDTVKRTGRTLSEVVSAAMTRMPQVLVSVPVHRYMPADGLQAVLGPITASAAERLGTTGRAVVRPSGTEPVIRVMVEADNQVTAHAEAERLTADITKALS